MSHDLVLVLDFGSQYTQLIARRLRELGVYCEVLPCTVEPSAIWRRNPRGLILSGGPESVDDPDAPAAPDGVFDAKIPVLGVCYGMQLMARVCGGDVREAPRRSFGHTRLRVASDARLFAGLPAELDAWASHGDLVHSLPDGFRGTASSEAAPISAFESPARKLYGVQFHPEVAHTDGGERILRNFAVGVCGARDDWSVDEYAGRAVADIRDKVGTGRVVCGVSGGVDSTVAAILVHRAVGDRLHSIFVDTGLLRKDETAGVRDAFRELRIPLVVVDAADRFLERLRGVRSPERKRRIIGREFIRVFEEAAREIEDARFLAQGTLYPDVIESVSVKGPSAVIKSHHNVGGLPKRMRLGLVEPLRELFKDEVRRLGRALGAPELLLGRHPFPGPGLAVRMLGPVDPEGLALLRESDAIVEEEIRRASLYDDVWQAFAVLLPSRAVGVMGDARSYDRVVAIRVVKSQDGMTADWVPLPPEVLNRISSRLTGEVRGVGRVAYDITSKPPGTIEWE